MFYLLFFSTCFFYEFEYDEFDEFEYFGKSVQVSRERKSALSAKNAWYFVNMRNFFSNDNHNNTNLEITPSNIITSDWYRLFLTPEQAHEINSRYNCIMKEFDNDDKIIDIDFSNDLFFAEFHQSFVPPQSEKIKFTLLFNSIYEISTKDVYRVLEIPELLFICNAPRNHFHNRWASGLTQHYGPPRMTEDGFRSSRYLKEHNISGIGQVVSIIDGGLDITNSFFYDQSYEFIFDELNPNHRKILYYDTYGNEHDSKNEGHGTHVAGTVAGKSTCGNSNSLYDGVAPDARIHFIDIGNDDESRKLLNIPITTLATEMGLAGSYISSNSWGSSSRNYGQTRLYDMASYYLRDRLFIFSAGNDGPSYITINSPGDSKNILTVGSLGSTYGQKFDSTNKRTLKLIVEDSNGIERSFNVNHVSGPDPFETTTGIYKSPTSSSPQAGYVYVTSTPNNVCNLSPAPLAAIIASSSSPSCSPSRYAVYKSDGNRNNILGAKRVTIDISISDSFFNPSVASYSSLGPSYFGIIKPDIVAPGDSIKSASSRPSDTPPGHGCSSEDFSVKSGTSMACPNIGGLATLVNQYFIDGYYPYGTYDPEKNGFVPGSSLLRAVIIASVNKLTDTWTPDLRYGHGIPSIDNVLTFDKNLKVFKDIDIGQNKDKFFRFTLKKVANNNKHLRIAMAYLDLPDETDTAILVIDIDMYLITPSGKILYGNSKPNNHEEHLSTIEKIILESGDIEDGEYQLHFYGGGRFTQAQFSLCIAGPLEGSTLYDISSYNQDALIWEDRNDSDICNFPLLGLNCQITPTEIEGNYTNITIPESSEGYLYFYLPENWTNFTLVINKDRGQGRVIFQLMGNNSYRHSYNYEKTHSTSDPIYNIFLDKKTLKNPNSTFISVRANNLMPTSVTVIFRIIYDRYVPPIPTATTPPATWKTAYKSAVIAGYALFAAALISTVALIIIFVDKVKQYKKLNKISSLSPD